jgi:hypothetical protein
MQYQHPSDEEMITLAVTDLLDSSKIVIFEQSHRGIIKPVMLVTGQTMSADYFEDGISPEALNLVNAHFLDQCIENLLNEGKIKVCGYDENGERLLGIVEQTLH